MFVYSDDYELLVFGVALAVALLIFAQAFSVWT
jgi:hypothetical protein